MSDVFEDLSCGACGSATVKLQQHILQAGLRAICQGCGSVSHIQPTAPRLVINWGNPRTGEKDDGILCKMAWPKEVKDG